MTDKYYKVIVSPKIEEHIYLRVPDGVEITEEILKNSWYFQDYWSESFLPVNPESRFEFNEVVKDLWDEIEHPTLDKDGDITFDYEEEEGTK